MDLKSLSLVIYVSKHESTVAVVETAVSFSFSKYYVCFALFLGRALLTLE